MAKTLGQTKVGGNIEEVVGGDETGAGRERWRWTIRK
jgi:hypothetical protein